ncbi:MAG: NADH-quinone oxidoreductase subunit J [Bdellovibrionota bacterium]
MGEALLFWFLALVTVGSGLAVILFANPIFCALSLAMTMVGVAAIFITLGAYFIAGVQLIVYAGAVMVLFVMVLMLFDLSGELKAFSRGIFSGGLKLASVGLIAGLIIGAITLSTGAIQTTDGAAAPMHDRTKELGMSLFSKHLFGFEALGVLLLVIAVGTVALARSKGGTHAKH